MEGSTAEVIINLLVKITHICPSQSSTQIVYRPLFSMLLLVMAVVCHSQGWLYQHVALIGVCVSILVMGLTRPLCQIGARDRVLSKGIVVHFVHNCVVECCAVLVSCTCCCN